MLRAAALALLLSAAAPAALADPPEGRRGNWEHGDRGHGDWRGERRGDAYGLRGGEDRRWRDDRGGEGRGRDDRRWSEHGRENRREGDDRWRDERRADDWRHDERRGHDHWRRDDRRYGDNAWRDPRHGYGDSRWRHDDHRYRDRDRGRRWYSEHDYVRHTRAPYRYRAYAWTPPPGWYARRWAWGEVLPRHWYAAAGYWLDWRAYNLPWPPVGCEWVRLGRDAILVDVWTGEVLSVWYDLFW
jgi:hypothetical protein